MKVRAATLAVVLLAVPACGGSGSGTAPTPAPGVSSLDYSPKPLSKDMTEVTVRFTTTGPAGPGLEYTAWLFTGEGDDGDTRCYGEFGPRAGVEGEAGKTYEQRIHLEEDGLHACFGEAALMVWTQSVEKPGAPVEIVREIPLEILPPRSGHWYSPRERATQLAGETYRWDGRSPPDDLRCFYTHTDDGGAEVYLCAPDLLHIACSAATTRRPLMGESDRTRRRWGDCAIV